MMEKTYIMKLRTSKGKGKSIKFPARYFKMNHEERVVEVAIPDFKNETALVKRIPYDDVRSIELYKGRPSKQRIIVDVLTNY